MACQHLKPDESGVQTIVKTDVSFVCSTHLHRENVAASKSGLAVIHTHDVSRKQAVLQPVLMVGCQSAPL